WWTANGGRRWESGVKWNRRPPGVKLAAIAAVTPSVISVKISAIRLTSRSRERRSASLPGVGMRQTARVPTSGIAPATVSQGKLVMADQRPRGGLVDLRGCGRRSRRRPGKAEEESIVELSATTRTLPVVAWASIRAAKGPRDIP